MPALSHHGTAHRLTRHPPELGDGVDRHVHHAANRPHGRPLAEHGEDLDALFERQFIHASHYNKPLCLTSGIMFRFVSSGLLALPQVDVGDQEETCR